MTFAAVLAATLSLLVAPAAHADIGFEVLPDGSASVEADDVDARVDVLRGGAVIATSDLGLVDIDQLLPGDVARVTVDGAVTETATYDGTPAFVGACIGRTAFTVRTGTGATLVAAGAFTDDAGLPIDATWDDAGRVTLPRALTENDLVFAAASVPGVYSTRLANVDPCSAATPQPGQPGTPTRTAPIGAAVRAAAAALRKLHPRRVARVPFVFAEAGTVTFELRARGHVIGRGKKTASGTAKVELKLTARGRRLVRKRLKVTLRATFTPSRARAEPQRASATVTLTGSSSRA